jgi:hypothetical protein
MSKPIEIESKPIVTFLLQGRLCNILYEYFATRVLQNYLKNLGLETEYKFFNRHFLHSIESNRSQHKDYLFIDEKDWYTTLKKDKNYFEGYKYIVLFGYFQSNDWLLNNRKFIKNEVFLTNNDDIISDEQGHFIHKISELVGNLNLKNGSEDSTLIVHIRLDDFFPSLIVNTKDYIDVIKKAVGEYKEIKEVKIIVDKVRYQFEVEYINELMNGIFITTNIKPNISVGNTLINDFSDIKNASYVISSNGTFSFIPIMLGDSKKNWIPKNEKISKVSHLTDTSETWDYNIWRQ